MNLLKLILITLLSTFMYATEIVNVSQDHAQNEHQKKVQKPEDIYYGTILEIKDAMRYKYLKINEEGKELWIAIADVPVNVGDKIGYDKKIPMQNFKSKSLDKTFKMVFFASELYLPKNVQEPQSLKESLGLNQKKQDIKPANTFIKKDAYTIDEVHRWRENLEGQIIFVEASVSKVSHAIMELDWVHLNDGTGSEKKLTNDLIFTAASTNIKAGDKVIAKGKVVVNKDFGFGYFYKVMIQDASFEVK